MSILRVLMLVQGSRWHDSSWQCGLDHHRPELLSSQSLAARLRNIWNIIITKYAKSKCPRCMQKPENKAWLQAQPLPLPVGTASHVGQSLFDSFQFCCFGFTIWTRKDSRLNLHFSSVCELEDLDQQQFPCRKAQRTTVDCIRSRTYIILFTIYWYNQHNLKYQHKNWWKIKLSGRTVGFDWSLSLEHWQPQKLCLICDVHDPWRVLLEP